MKCTPITRRCKKPTLEHAAATALALKSACLLCDKLGCDPAHFPRHRGSGGRWPDPWARKRWVPLCWACHNFIDSREGGVGILACTEREEAREYVLKRARETWWGQ